MTGNAKRLVRFFILTAFGVLLAPRVFAVPIGPVDRLTIFNPNHTVFRSISLTPDQTHGGATAVLADSLETVPGAFGSQLPLLDILAGVSVLKGHGVPFPAAALPPGTGATRVFGIFSLSGSAPDVVFLNFVTGDAITHIGSPGDFSLVWGAPISITPSTPTRIYDATSFLSPDARTAGYTAVFKNGISDTGSTCLLLAIALFAIIWFRRKSGSAWS
jgi:hypothetical protein